MALNPKPSALDQDQIIRRVFDGDNDKLRVDATVSLEPGTLSLDSTTDSVTIGNDAGIHTTITTVGPKKALDVNVANDVNLVIDATNDSIAIGDASGNLATVTTVGAKLGLDVNVINEIPIVIDGLSGGLSITTKLIGDSQQQITSGTAHATISIHNKDSFNIVYIGKTGVQANSNIGATAGWEIPPLSMINMDITEAVLIYAITESSKTAKVKVMEISK